MYKTPTTADQQLSGDFSCDSASTSSIEMETVTPAQVVKEEAVLPEASACGDSNPTPVGKMGMEEEELGASASGGAVGGVENVIDQLLERNKSEIMFELRKLKMGDRPVTGQGNKEAVEGFFQRAIDSNNGVPVDTEEHRPDAVVVEVQGLVERRPVSSLLQSFNFRRQLESAIRSSFATVTSRDSQVNQRQQSSSAAAAPAPPAAPRESPRRRPQAAAAPSVQPQPRQSIDIANIRQAAGQAAARMAQARLARREAAPPAPPPLPAVVPAGHIPAPPPLPDFAALPAEPSGPQRAEAWVQQQPFNGPLQENGERSVAAMWGDVQEVHRDSFIEEVSELIQRQLVTSSLESNFRSHLETIVSAHVDQAGADGSQVASFIRTLPPTGHLRNDFSDLGINVPRAASLSDNLDEVSVISATAAVHVAQNHVSPAVNRELHSLRSQIAELKSMMRLSFDLQLDIQRAIRQEVAAAVSQTLGGATAAPTPSRPVRDDSCLICLDKSTDTVLYQCGHMCVCYPCGLQLKQRGAHCPMCRAPIKDIIRAYRNNTH